MSQRTRWTLLLALMLSGTATAAPTRYELDPDHTYPSFEADHMGISVWRGKFNRSHGTLTLDRAAESGTVNAVIDISSVDFGHDKMNEHAVSADFFDVAQYPTATYKGRLADFVDGAPTRVIGDLTLHGVTQPVVLHLSLFKCIEHPMSKREACGADATASFERDAFGLTAGKDYGFDMTVTLRIQMEAQATE